MVSIRSVMLHFEHTFSGHYVGYFQRNSFIVFLVQDFIR